MIVGEKCKKCNGLGMLQINCCSLEGCPDCEGTGYIKDNLTESNDIDMEAFEAEVKAAFKETYTAEWLEHVDKQSTARNNIVEIMYQSFVSGYFAAMAEHYRG